MITGKIKFFNIKKGFGFIVEDETQNEIFFHVSGLLDKPVGENDAVTYEVVEDKKGIKAINVKKI
ncbi:MAG: cold shock domain-containing protein [Lentimicrobiaceae bacterium]|jgi:CspA family cold shock protein|nr:cold shock domain-containing protein [Lentimicrobiaceae bacterium]